MLKQKTKDIEIGGKKYRLTKLDARTASYVAAKIAILVVPLVQGGKKLDVGALGSLLPNLSRGDFAEMQDILLSSVRHLVAAGDNEMPEPILKADGSFVDDELSYDAMTVIGLTANAAIFNIGDFFDAARLGQMAK
jgi:hypothetical protein